MSLWSIIVAVLFSNALAFPSKDLLEDEDRVKDGDFSVVADEGSSIGADEGSSIGADEGSSVGADESSNIAADEVSRAIKKIFKIWPPTIFRYLTWLDLISCQLPVVLGSVIFYKLVWCCDWDRCLPVLAIIIALLLINWDN